MTHTVYYTKPTKIRSLETYKRRMKEIVFGQIRNLYRKERLLNPLFWVFAIWYIPLSCMYESLCWVEAIFDTLLLPFALIPVIRIIPNFIQMFIFYFTAAVGCFCVDQTYQLDDNKNEPYE